MSDTPPTVRCEPQAGGWRCHVVVESDTAETEHEVLVDRETLNDLAPGATPEVLVAESFRFLLEREPPESILRSFELPIIGRYFGDYADEIRRRMAG
jgi:hypothetical protein